MLWLDPRSQAKGSTHNWRLGASQLALNTLARSVRLFTGAVSTDPINQTLDACRVRPSLILSWIGLFKPALSVNLPTAPSTTTVQQSSLQNSAGYTQKSRLEAKIKRQTKHDAAPCIQTGSHRLEPYAVRPLKARK